jgi:hypothetical protein
MQDQGRYAQEFAMDNTIKNVEGTAGRAATESVARTTSNSYRDYDNSPFSGGAILPVQYFESLKKEDPRIVPYKRLLMAVLEDAVRCFQANVGATGAKGRRLFNETELWMRNDSADGPFSYVSVCETLGIDPAYLRRALMDWKTKRLAGQIRRPLVRRSPVMITHRVSAPRVRNRTPRTAHRAQNVPAASAPGVSTTA